MHKASQVRTISWYIEAVRAIYAFDLTQVRTRATYQPYAFGWSYWHLKRELEIAGFSTVFSADETHGRRIWRDIRGVAQR